MKVWTTLQPDEIRQVARDTGLVIFSDWGGHGISKDGRAWNFRLGLDTSDPSQKKEHGSWRYQRTSASAFHPERKVAAVCWHGHRDFMLALYERDPEARIKSAFADYRGREDFMEKYPETAHRNVGSMMYPMAMSEVCTCSSSTWLIDLSTSPSMSTYTMQQSMIGGCPFVIFDPTHYRADGTCKCNDPDEQARMIREWDYTPEDFAAKGLASV